jgi:hypothetical protein
MNKFIKSWPELVEGMRLALDAIRTNKFRSIMTIIGVMIGVGAVILVNTIMDGFTQYTYQSIDKIGRNVMYISQWSGHEDWDNLTEEERRRKPITMDEAYAIRDYCSLVDAVCPQKSARNNVLKYEERKSARRMIFAAHGPSGRMSWRVRFLSVVPSTTTTWHVRRWSSSSDRKSPTRSLAPMLTPSAKTSASTATSFRSSV